MKFILFVALAGCAAAAPRPDALADLNRVARGAYAEARGLHVAKVLEGSVRKEPGA